MEESRKSKIVPWLALVISLVAAVLTAGALYWQKYMWDHGTANLTVEQMGENGFVTSVMVTNSGRASATVGGFTLRSQNDAARILLYSATDPIVNGSTSGGIVATKTSTLPPGGLEYFVLSYDAVAYECVNKNIDLQNVKAFLTTGNGDVSFDLTESALSQISTKMSEFRSQR